MHLGGLCPVRQLHDQIRNILWKRTEMQDIPFAIHHTHRTCAEHAGFLHQAPRHDTVGSQQVIHRIRVKLIQPLINLIGIFDFSNILWGKPGRVSRSARQLPAPGKGYSARWPESHGSCGFGCCGAASDWQNEKILPPAAPPARRCK